MKYRFAFRALRPMSAIACFMLLQTAFAAAAVTDSAPNGFTLRETAHIAATPDQVYAGLITPSHWWSPDHTFSGNAANLSLDARAGGCWCESLPDGGSVEHLVVVMAAPGKALRLRGALGPFQTLAVDGAMAWTLTPNSGGTDVTLTYSLGGYAKGGFDQIAKAADGVLGEQVTRLKRDLETGSPDVQEEKKP